VDYNANQQEIWVIFNQKFNFIDLVHENSPQTAKKSSFQYGSPNKYQEQSSKMRASSKYNHRIQEAK